MSTAYGFATGLFGMPAGPGQYLPRAYQLTISPALVLKNTTAEQTFTVTGLQTGDAVFVNKPTNQAGLGITNVRVTAADTIGISFINASTTAITPTASQTYMVVAIKAS